MMTKTEDDIYYGEDDIPSPTSIRRTTTTATKARSAADFCGGRDDGDPLPSSNHGDGQTNWIKFISFVCPSQV